MNAKITTLPKSQEGNFQKSTPKAVIFLRIKQCKISFSFANLSSDLKK